MQADVSLENEIKANRTFGVSICERLSQEMNKLGFASDEIKCFPFYDEATFLLIKDPFTGLRNLTGYWYTVAHHHRIGSLQFNSDGTVYAEYDIAKPHPSKKQCFVECVMVWGKIAQLKAEAKLLPMPD